MEKYLGNAGNKCCRSVTAGRQFGGDILPKVGSGGTKKIGRNKQNCQAYKNDNRREKNRIRRWKKIIKHLLPNNNTRKELEIRIKKLESMGA